MARPKGSKNKTKVLDGIDYAAQIAEKILPQNLLLRRLQHSAQILPH
ncbi:MAG: hypothetical protein ACLRWM_00440 [Streptococcus sp.]